MSVLLRRKKRTRPQEIEKFLSRFEVDGKALNKLSDKQLFQSQREYILKQFDAAKKLKFSRSDLLEWLQSIQGAQQPNSPQIPQRQTLLDSESTQQYEEYRRHPATKRSSEFIYEDISDIPSTSYNISKEYYDVGAQRGLETIREVSKAPSKTRSVQTAGKKYVPTVTTAAAADGRQFQGALDERHQQEPLHDVEEVYGDSESIVWTGGPIIPSVETTESVQSEQPSQSTRRQATEKSLNPLLLIGEHNFISGTINITIN